MRGAGSCPSEGPAGGGLGAGGAPGRGRTWRAVRAAAAAATHNLGGGPRDEVDHGLLGKQHTWWGRGERV